MAADLNEAFDQSYIPEPNSGCWLWLRHTQVHGYGIIGSQPFLAHRVSYERYKGLIPSGLVIDHLCRVRCCVNPDHLEAVTQGENIRRSSLVGKWSRGVITHCPQGHEYNAENTLTVTRRGGTSRQCRECGRIRCRRRRALKRARDHEPENSPDKS